MKTSEIIDERMLDSLTGQAKESPRLRMNLNFHQSLEDKCHRFLNALEMGSKIPVHHHPTKDESFVVLRGKVRVSTYDDAGRLIDNIVLDRDEQRYGANIPRNVWHTVEPLVPGTVIFECKEGPFIPHEIEGVLDVE